MRASDEMDSKRPAELIARRLGLAAAAAAVAVVVVAWSAAVVTGSFAVAGVDQAVRTEFSRSARYSYVCRFQCVCCGL